MQEYADFKVDEVPITTNLLKPVKSFQEIIQEKLKNGLKPIKEVKSRNGAIAPCSCPFCKAPTSYIYDNNKRGQWLCKVCTNTFTIHTTNVDEIGYFCPYCEYKLQIITRTL